MKLRIRSNSVRFRLTQGEVQQFAESGRIEASIDFGGKASDRLGYELAMTEETIVRASFAVRRITVLIPENEARSWAQSSQVGIEATQQIDEGKTLQILVEKDFACLEPRSEDDLDTFPNPLQCSGD